MSSRLTAALAIGCLVIAGVTSAEAMRGEPQESRAVAHPEALQVAVKVTPTIQRVRVDDASSWRNGDDGAGNQAEASSTVKEIAGSPHAVAAATEIF